MHPTITAWLAYKAELDRQPSYLSSDWGPWLYRVSALEKWWATMRRASR